MASTQQRTLGDRRLRDLTDAEFEELYDCDRFTATVLGSKFRYIIKHMCTHLMTNAFSVILRDWYDFAATLSGPPQLGYPMAAISDSLVDLRGADVGGGAELGRGVRAGEPPARRHPDEQRPVPDRHAPERHPVRSPDLPRGRARRDPQHPAAHDGRRRHRPGRLRLAQGERVRERPHDPADADLSRRQADQVDVQPAVRQRAVRRGDAPRHAVDRSRPPARRAAAARGDRAVRAEGVLRGAPVRDRRLGRVDARGDHRGAGRRLRR